MDNSRILTSNWVRVRVIMVCDVTLVYVQVHTAGEKARGVGAGSIRPPEKHYLLEHYCSSACLLIALCIIERLLIHNIVRQHVC